MWKHSMSNIRQTTSSLHWVKNEMPVLIVTFYTDMVWWGTPTAHYQSGGAQPTGGVLSSGNDPLSRAAFPVSQSRMLCFISSVRVERSSALLAQRSSHWGWEPGGLALWGAKCLTDVTLCNWLWQWRGSEHTHTAHTHTTHTPHFTLPHSSLTIIHLKIITAYIHF